MNSPYPQNVDKKHVFFFNPSLSDCGPRPCCAALGAVHILCNQFLAFFRPLPPYVINCNHLGGPPPLIKCNTVIILGLPPFLRT